MAQISSIKSYVIHSGPCVSIKVHQKTKSRLLSLADKRGGYEFVIRFFVEELKYFYLKCSLQIKLL